MRFRILASGSSGNATLVESGSTRIIVDAGLGPRHLAERLRGAGVDPASVEAIFLSHEHRDHAKGAASFSRKWGTRIVATPGTYAASGLAATEIAAFQGLSPFESLRVGALAVTAVPVSHDAAEPVAFVVEGDGHRLGHATDLGQMGERLVRALAPCAALLLESNYDPTLLANGPYPWALKERIFGARGHLSNADVAQFLSTGLGDACRLVVLAHLSEQNNHPELAQMEATRALARCGRQNVCLGWTGREGTDWFEVARAPVPPAGAQRRLF